MTKFIIIAAILIAFIIVKSCEIKPMRPQTNSYSAVVKLPLKQVRQIYSLNPERLRYEEVQLELGEQSFLKCLLLNYEEEPQWKLNTLKGCYDIYIGYEDVNNIVAVHLSAIDSIKFHLLKRKTPNNNMIEEAILQAMQHDIDNLRAKAQKQIEEARKINDKIKRSV